MAKDQIQNKQSREKVSNGESKIDTLCSEVVSRQQDQGNQENKLPTYPEYECLEKGRPYTLHPQEQQPGRRHCPFQPLLNLGKEAKGNIREQGNKEGCLEYPNDLFISLSSCMAAYDWL
jgi:hypothetical protein